MYRDDTPGGRSKLVILFVQCDHHIRHINILPTGIIASNLEDDILLMRWDLLLADVLHELRHPTEKSGSAATFINKNTPKRQDSLHGKTIFVLRRWREAEIEQTDTTRDHRDGEALLLEFVNELS